MNRPIEGAVVHRIEVDGGAVAVEDGGGDGPVMLCLPALGDLRQEYRLLAPRLRAMGIRVLLADLRGHGDSDVTFASYRPEDIGADALAILDGLAIPHATLVGCSISAGAVAWVAANAPQRVSSLVMLGGLVRDMPGGLLVRMLLPIMMARPWGVAFWGAFFKSLFKSRRPDDLDEYWQRLRHNLHEPGRLKAARHMAMASKRGIENLLGNVTCPTVFIVGSKDPDFPDPAQEPDVLRDKFAGPFAAHVLDNLGHYPHVEAPETVATIIADRQVHQRVPHAS